MYVRVSNRNVQADAVRIISRPQWFLINRPIVCCVYMRGVYRSGESRDRFRCETDEERNVVIAQVPGLATIERFPSWLTHA